MSITRRRGLKSFEPSAADYLRLNATHQESGWVRNESSQLRYAQGRPGFLVEDAAAGQILCEITSLYGGAADSDEAITGPQGRVSFIGVKLKGPSNADGFDTNGLKGEEFLAAKSLAMRMPKSDTDYDYKYTDDSHRTSDDGSGTTSTNPEKQQLTPLLGIGNLIFIEPCNYSFANPAGATDLKWIVCATEFEWTCPSTSGSYPY